MKNIKLKDNKINYIDKLCSNNTFLLSIHYYEYNLKDYLDICSLFSLATTCKYLNILFSLYVKKYKRKQKEFIPFYRRKNTENIFHVYGRKIGIYERALELGYFNFANWFEKECSDMIYDTEKITNWYKMESFRWKDEFIRLKKFYYHLNSSSLKYFKPNLMKKDREFGNIISFIIKLININDISIIKCMLIYNNCINIFELLLNLQILKNRNGWKYFEAEKCKINLDNIELNEAWRESLKFNIPHFGIEAAIHQKNWKEFFYCVNHGQKPTSYCLMKAILFKNIKLMKFIISSGVKVKAMHYFFAQIGRAHV